jgi:hypothetical protein
MKSGVAKPGFKARAVVCGGLILLGVAGMATAAFGQGSATQPAAGEALLRELKGEELLEARSARIKAHRLNLMFQNNYPIIHEPGRQQNPKLVQNPADNVGTADYKAVVEAYQQVIKRYPKTAVGAAMQLELGRFYLSGNQWDLMIQAADEVAKTYRGTRYENDAYAFAGWVLLKLRHQPEPAMEWLKKMRKPSEAEEYVRPPGDEHARDPVDVYISGQMHLIYAEMMVRDFAMADARLERVCERYPENAAACRKQMEMDRKWLFKSSVRPKVSEVAMEDAKRRLEMEELALGPAGGAGKASTGPGAETRRLLNLMETTAAGAARDKLIKDVAARGKEAVPLIEERLATRRTSIVWEQMAVLVLAEIGSKEAQGVVRAVALGTTGRGSEQKWAAQFLVKMNPEEGKGLLGSKDANVVTEGLNAICGKGLSEACFGEVEGLLKSADAMVRWRAAAVMAQEPSGQYAGRAALAIGEAMERVPSLADAERVKGAKMGWAQSTAEENYQRYLQALVAMTNGEQALAEATGKVNGRAGDVMAIARGLRKDARVYDRLVLLSQDRGAEMLRAWAVQALGVIGTEVDIGLMEELAKNDPLERNYAGSPLPGQGNPTHPVREAAVSAVKEIRGRGVAR